MRKEIKRLQEENKVNNLAKLVPSIFVTQGDRPDTFVLEANKKWTKDKYPRELLPALRIYKTALINALREAEWTIKYLQEDGLYPMDKLHVKIKWETRDDNSLHD